MTSAPTALETVELFDEGSGARAFLAPRRGGLITRFLVGERPVLFLDESTLLDETKNVRGGVPVLFPSPGKLKDGRYQRQGRTGALAQHGFARNLPWEVEASSATEATLRLAADAHTKAQFPWDFLLRYRISLRGTALRIEQEIHNRGGEPMPFASGFHPYFFVPQAQKAGARIETGATRAWDNAAGREVRLEGPIDLTVAEVDLHLIDHGRADCALLLGDGARIEVRGSPHFQRWVIWTLAGRDFVCLEPWTAPGDALNTGEGLTLLPPGESARLWTELALEEDR